MLPATPSVKGGSNKVKTDMQGIGGKAKKAKLVGSLKKNPGSKGARKRA